MPADEYVSAGASGALRLKGAKVEKHKKKHKHRKKKLEAVLQEEERREKSQEKEKEKKETDSGEGAAEEDPYARMTTAERRFAEAQDRKIRDLMKVSPEEAKASHPELFKSHKERLADLNTYLSRMSEHHDMPKIGPG